MTATVLILAPHPDDESITGLLPLRLKEECGFRVWVVPATLGSRADRRAARARELRAACRALGFGVRFLAAEDPAAELPAVLAAIRPDAVFLPHAKDGHPTHRATHRLGVAAMDAAGGGFHVVETEYWHPLERPNLMVAAKKSHVAALQKALACHVGEVARNDYAARLPAWMSDNVRRGAELVGGKGAAAPNMAYATLYRARIRAGGKWRAPYRGGRIVETPEQLRALAAAWV
ncbi:MAG TPA: PIG-L family deacetylase [Kiritimatiellia bacterium]|nr:PIG-L family deacetylase [Kiritimatiellia bacterium]